LLSCVLTNGVFL